jgi:hypothetical protein
VSNRKRLPRQEQHPASAILAAADGARIPGGCGHCDAYQVIHAQAGHPNVHLIRVYHDDWCPFLAGRQSR